MSKPTITLKENKAIGEKYYHFLHKSGLNVYVIPKALSTSYAIFGTRYGSIDNRFKVSGKYNDKFITVPDGIAHFLEHKLFENEDGEDTFVKYSRTGASGNAYTSFLLTAYLFSSTEKFYESLNILLSTTQAPYFTDENVNKEKGIIGQEIQMYEDDPGNALFFGLLDALYTDHEVATKICGSIESIDKITPEILYDCYKTFYNLHNMALVVVGDVAPEATLAVCDKVLIDAPPVTITREYGAEKPEVKTPLVKLKRQVSQPQFIIGIKDLDIKTGEAHARKSAALDILCDALFSVSEPFGASLYEEGLVPEPIYAGAMYNHSCSMIEIGGQSDKPEEVYVRYKKYIAKVKKDGLSKAAFERAKRGKYADTLRSFNSSERIGGAFLSLLFEGVDMLDFPSVIAGITYEETAALLSVFDEAATALAIVNPLDK